MLGTTYGTPSREHTIAVENLSIENTLLTRHDTGRKEDWGFNVIFGYTAIQTMLGVVVVVVNSTEGSYGKRELHLRKHPDQIGL